MNPTRSTEHGNQREEEFLHDWLETTSFDEEPTDYMETTRDEYETDE